MIDKLKDKIFMGELNTLNQIKLTIFLKIKELFVLV